MKVMFVEARDNTSLLPVAKSILPEVKQYKSVCLVTTVQHAHKLKEVKDYLESNGKKVYVEKPGSHCIYPGQVLGCDTKAANTKADAIVYIGTGEFHPSGIKSDKPVFIANTISKKISKLDLKLEEKKRIMRAAKVRLAKKIGILVSTKPGQNRLAEAEELKIMLEKEGKEAYLFLGDMIMPSELMNFPDIEAWVNTACPRLVEDEFEKPIANWNEI